MNKDDAELFDCMQVNLAALAERRNGLQYRFALGKMLQFKPRIGSDGLPTVEPSERDYIFAAEQWLGLRLVDRQNIQSVSQLHSMAEKYGCLYVIADAFDLRWVPYFTHKHMDHSFLIELEGAGFLIADNYCNETQWGAARPGSWSMSHLEVDELCSAGIQAFAFEPQTPPSVPLSLKMSMVSYRREVSAYLSAYRQHPSSIEALERLTLETWLMARSRRLYVAWYGDSFPVSNTLISEHLAGWRSQVEHTYIAYRRSARGGGSSAAVLDRLARLLEIDGQIFFLESLRNQIALATAQVFEVSVEEILNGTVFSSFATFSSFRVVEMIEFIEDQVGFSFNPDDLTPENLHSIEGLCRIAFREAKESLNEPAA